jgi:hypothetical protein
MPPLSYNRSSRIYFILPLIAACVLVYWPVFTHNFQFSWDDQWVVLNDYTEGGLGFDNITYILTQFYHGQYAPVNQLFYLLLYNAFGYSPFWFHTASLLVHIANVLLVFSLIKKILTASKEFNMQAVLRISFFTAMMMAIHPFLVEAVSWMSASKCILFSLFYLLSLHAYVNYITTKKTVYYIATLILFILSFGAKEQALTMPACLLLLDYTLKRDMKSSRLWFGKLPFFCLSFSFAVITFYSQAFNGEGVLSASHGYPIHQNIVFACYTVIEYFIKCLLPVRLNYLYPFPNQPDEPMSAFYWIYPVILLVVGLAFWKTLSKRWVIFGLGFFLIQISIASNLVPTSRYAIVADRYVYLPSVGVFFLVAWCFNTIWEKAQWRRNLVFASSVVCFLTLAVYANARCKVWHDSTTLKSELKRAIHSRKDYGDWVKQHKEMTE